MADRFSTTKRSEIMSHVRGKDTAPELQVRSWLHALGYRFRLHRKDLPGRPDIVLARYRVAVFVHGCFWHQHPGCLKATLPKPNRERWAAKLARNVERDRENREALELAGWAVAIVWECELGPPAVVATLEKFLPDLESRGVRTRTVDEPSTVPGV